MLYHITCNQNDFYIVNMNAIGVTWCYCFKLLKSINSIHENTNKCLLAPIMQFSNSVRCTITFRNIQWKYDKVCQTYFVTCVLGSLHGAVFVANMERGEGGARKRRHGSAVCTNVVHHPTELFPILLKSRTRRHGDLFFQQ